MSSEKWKIILCPLGSWGDVHPFVWLGKLLVRRGYDVTALVAEPFEPAMQHVGVKTVRMMSAEDFEAFTRHPDLWHPRKAFEVVANSVLQVCLSTIDAIRENVVPEKTLIISGAIAFGARIFAEAEHIPHITIQLQPTSFISAKKPSLMAAGLECVEYLPYPLRYILFELIHLKIDSILKKRINEFRDQQGLKNKVSRIMGDYWQSPDGVIATFPEWFAAKASDWPAQTHLTRFPLYDEEDRLERCPELESFLREGDAPILFTPGTANSDAGHFFTEAAKVCTTLNRRGVFVTRYPEQVPSGLPESIRIVRFAPFSQIFPHCAAVVHHGGIGTTAQGLAAGVPQLVMALSHDQPDNGLRLKRLGVGDYIYPKHFRAEIVAPKIKHLITSPKTKAACLRYKEEMQKQVSEETVADLIEELGRKAGLT